MKFQSFSLPATICLLLFVSSELAFAQSTIKKEIDVGFADMEAVRPLLKGVLSPVGKFVLLANKGSVIVIDTPEGIAAAERALGGDAMPKPNVALDFQFITGLPPRNTFISVVREVPLPVEFAPPRIIGGYGGQPFTVIPATPTKFEKRDIGVTNETTRYVNPDGSMTMDIRQEVTEFEGFVNYGSAILPAGGVGTLPVSNGVSDPNFFNPFINSGDINLPIISTTRITTSIVVRPRVNLGVVSIDVMPRLTVVPDLEAGDDFEPYSTDLPLYETVIDVKNRELARIYGFTGADDDFNRRFFGAENSNEGSIAVVVKANATRAVEPPARPAAK